MEKIAERLEIKRSWQSEDLISSIDQYEIHSRLLPRPAHLSRAAATRIFLIDQRDQRASSIWRGSNPTDPSAAQRENAIRTRNFQCNNTASDLTQRRGKRRSRWGKHERCRERKFQLRFSISVGARRRPGGGEGGRGASGRTDEARRSGAGGGCMKMKNSGGKEGK